MFAEKTFIITGASSGLGKQMAYDLSGSGANCVLFGRNEDKLAETLLLCEEQGGQAISVIGDVSQPDDCERLVDEAVKRFGGIDVYISNAGLSMWASFDQVKDLGIFRQLMEVNYMGAVHGAHYALPHLRKSAGQFVAIASIQSRMAIPHHTGYAASKHALEGFCHGLRYDLEGTGVNILTVHPHWIRGTDMRANAFSFDGDVVGKSKRSHNKESITSEECSLAVLKAIHKRKSELIIPNKLRLVPWLKLLWPGYLRWKVRSIIRGQGK